jgi:hypothetical protein
MDFGYYIALYSHQETHNKWANQRAWIFELRAEISSILPNYFLGRLPTIPLKHNHLYINVVTMVPTTSSVRMTHIHAQFDVVYISLTTPIKLRCKHCKTKPLVDKIKGSTFRSVIIISSLWRR